MNQQFDLLGKYKSKIEIIGIGTHSCVFIQTINGSLYVIHLDK